MEICEIIVIFILKFSNKVVYYLFYRMIFFNFKYFCNFDVIWYLRIYIKIGEKNSNKNVIRSAE